MQDTFGDSALSDDQKMAKNMKVDSILVALKLWFNKYKLTTKTKDYIDHILLYMYSSLM